MTRGPVLSTRAEPPHEPPPAPLWEARLGGLDGGLMVRAPQVGFESEKVQKQRLPKLTASILYAFLNAPDTSLSARKLTDILWNTSGIDLDKCQK